MESRDLITKSKWKVWIQKSKAVDLWIKKTAFSYKLFERNSFSMNSIFTHECQLKKRIQNVNDNQSDCVGVGEFYTHDFDLQTYSQHLWLCASVKWLEQCNLYCGIHKIARYGWSVHCTVHTVYLYACACDMLSTMRCSCAVQLTPWRLSLFPIRHLCESAKPK